MSNPWAADSDNDDDEGAGADGKKRFENVRDNVVFLVDCSARMLEVPPAPARAAGAGPATSAAGAGNGLSDGRDVGAVLGGKGGEPLAVGAQPAQSTVQPAILN